MLKLKTELQVSLSVLAIQIEYVIILVYANCNLSKENNLAAKH